MLSVRAWALVSLGWLVLRWFSHKHVFTATKWSRLIMFTCCQSRLRRFSAAKRETKMLCAYISAVSNVINSHATWLMIRIVCDLFTITRGESQTCWFIFKLRERSERERNRVPMLCERMRVFFSFVSHFPFSETSEKLFVRERAKQNWVFQNNIFCLYKNTLQCFQLLIIDRSSSSSNLTKNFHENQVDSNRVREIKIFYLLYEFYRVNLEDIQLSIAQLKKRGAVKWCEFCRKENFCQRKFVWKVWRNKLETTSAKLNKTFSIKSEIQIIKNFCEKFQFVFFVFAECLEQIQSAQSRWWKLGVRSQWSRSE